MVAAPAQHLDDAAQERLLEQMRATLARLRQAGMATDELLRVARREIEALAAGGERP